MSKVTADSPYKFYTVRSKDGFINDSEKNFSFVSWFTNGPDGKGILKRQCTDRFKIAPIHSKIRDILGLRLGQSTDNPVTLWIGISTDEKQRVRVSKQKWITFEYPLIQIDWDRTDCAVYGSYHFGYSIPKSSCYFCPFTNTNEWIRRKKENPDLFEQACQLDDQLRTMSIFKTLRNQPFVHSSGKPLREVIKDDINDTEIGLELGFSKECSGNCGI
jgi:hypothetical protein